MEMQLTKLSTIYNFYWPNQYHKYLHANNSYTVNVPQTCVQVWKQTCECTELTIPTV